ncbi:carbonic anhydrase family protein [Serratia marcescens]|nr:carbonic anhydrase family protein [Serratia marcescens]MBH2766669.1 carbonic anhydrase family protein [Serratia marcescens]MBH2766729.1 carbonic anhydrase family protein [Serratia marcescens]
MKMRILVSAIALTINMPAIAEELSSHWSYDGQTNPAHWDKLSPDFSLCGTGKNQSPIDIEGALNANQSPLHLSFKPQNEQKIVNNGHTIQVNTSGDNTLILDNDNFKLQQFHFHAPSENKIDGKQFPLEAHFVYKDRDGALTVLALMFKEGKSNAQLSQAWQQMPRKPGQVMKLSKPLDISSLLPNQLGFYRFSGSLTTPPCTEGVRWVVLKKAVSASAEQIKEFRSVMHHANNRPEQPLDGRVIVSS